MWKFLSLFFLLLLFPLLTFAQFDYVFIDSIQIKGNKKTKDRIILREMKIEVGDSIHINELNRTLELNEKLILNAGLFTWGKINIKTWDPLTNRITLLIELAEAWYIYPFPIFELADRNFNVWWGEQNRSFKRVNYGLRINHHNTTGHNDPAKLVVQAGYTQKYELRYTLPPLNDRQTYGITAELFYAKNREIGYTTTENKLLFERRENEFPEQRFRAGVSFVFRPKFRSFHFFKIGFQQNTISDFVITDLNPNYFMDGNTRQRFIHFRYEYVYENRDIIPYPLSGNFLSVALEKEGIGIFGERNGFYLTGKFAQYLSFKKKWSVELIGKGMVSLVRTEQPYNKYKALGYFGDYLRGYELYVIDGLDYGYFKTSLRYELINERLKVGDLLPVKLLRWVPLRIYFTMNSDAGYVNDPQFHQENPLTNQWLWGGGFGLDINIFYGSTFQVEYSINHLKEKGLFLHYKLKI